MSAIRRMMMRADKVDPYADLVRGSVTMDAYVVNEDPTSNLYVLPVVQTTHNVDVYAASPNAHGKWYNKTTGKATAVTGYNINNRRTCEHRYANYDLFRCEASVEHIDDVFIYDAVDGIYLWAGKNVDTSVPPT